MLEVGGVAKLPPEARSIGAFAWVYLSVFLALLHSRFVYSDISSSEAEKHKRFHLNQALQAATQQHFSCDVSRTFSYSISSLVTSGWISVHCTILKNHEKLRK